MSAALEKRYRAALRWYPRAWRTENADAIVGTMLDQAEAEGRVAPQRGELRDLASSGLHQRFERVAPQVVRDRVSAVALAIGTAFALIVFVGSEWAPFAETGPLNGWVFPAGSPNYRDYSTVGFGPFASVLVIVYGLWFLAFIFVTLRLSRTAIVVLLLTVPVLAWVRTLRFEDIGTLQPTTPSLILIALLAILASIGRPARVGRVALAAIVVGTVVMVIALLAADGHPPIFEGRLGAASATFSVLNAPGLAVSLVLAGIVLAILRLRGWAVAALVSAAPWVPLAALYFLPWTAGSFGIAAGMSVLCIVAAILVWKTRMPRPTTAPD